MGTLTSVGGVEMGPPEMVKQTKGGTNIRPGIRIRIEGRIAMCEVIIKRWTDEERDMQQQQQWIEATRTNARADKIGYIQHTQAETREVAPREKTTPAGSREASHNNDVALSSD